MVCLSSTHLLIILSVFLGSAAWYIHNDKKKHVDDPNYKYDDKLITSIIKNLMDSNKTIGDENAQKRQFLNKRDVEVLYNSLMPPERRQPEHTYPTNYIKSQLNIPTRGFPDNYQLVGVVLRNNTESAYRLFGRQKYPGSNQYEYYVEGNMDDTPIKLPITVRGDREIEDNQVIEIPGTNPTKGEFRAKLYNFDTPRYVPII